MIIVLGLLPTIQMTLEAEVASAIGHSTIQILSVVAQLSLATKALTLGESRCRAKGACGNGHQSENREQEQSSCHGEVDCGCEAVRRAKETPAQRRGVHTSHGRTGDRQTGNFSFRNKEKGKKRHTFWSAWPEERRGAEFMTMAAD